MPNATTTTVTKQAIVQDPPTTYGPTLTGLRDIKNTVRNKLQSAQKAEKIPLSIERLQEAWLEIAEKITTSKVLYKAAIMQTQTKFAGENITLVTNNVVLDYLKEQRNMLLEFFKKKFHNESINVLFELEAEKPLDPNKRVMSTKEIFEQMVLKNPLLRELKDGLGMDFDY